MTSTRLNELPPSLTERPFRQPFINSTATQRHHELRADNSRHPHIEPPHAPRILNFHLPTFADDHHPHLTSSYYISEVLHTPRHHHHHQGHTSTQCPPVTAPHAAQTHTVPSHQPHPPNPAAAVTPPLPTRMRPRTSALPRPTARASTRRRRSKTWRARTTSKSRDWDRRLRC